MFQVSQGPLLHRPQLGLRQLSLDIGISGRHRELHGGANQVIRRGDFDQYRGELFVAFNRVQRIIREQFANHNARFGVTMTVYTQNHPEGRPLGFQPHELAWFTPQTILNLLEKAIVSEDSYYPFFTFHMWEIQGRQQGAPLHLAGRSIFRGDFNSFIAKKKSIIQIGPPDDPFFQEGMCFAQWCVLAQAYNQNQDVYKTLTKGSQRFKKRYKYAQELLQMNPNRYTPFQSLDMLQEIEQQQGCDIVLYDLTQQMKIVYPPEEKLPRKTLDRPIWCGIITPSATNPSDKHIDFVLKPGALFGSNKRWCPYCFVDFTRVPYCTRCKEHKDIVLCPVCHVCNKRCPCCLELDCIPNDDEVVAPCHECNIIPQSSICFDRHICKKDGRVEQCPICFQRNHPGKQCGEYKCACGKLRMRDDDTHVCYIPRKELKAPSDDWAVYDFECAVDPKTAQLTYDIDPQSGRTIPGTERPLPGTGEHVPYLVTMWFPTCPFTKPFIKRKTKKKKKNSEDDEDEDIEEPITTIIHPEDPIHPYRNVLKKYKEHAISKPEVEGPIFIFTMQTMKSFIQFLQEPVWAKWTFFAHNGRGYDHILIKQAFMDVGIPSQDIRRGQKYIQMFFPQLKITFRDSLSFITSSLREMPKQFHVQEIAKGYFPHEIMNSDLAEQLFDLNQRPLVDKPPIEAFHFEFGWDETGLKEKKKAEEWYNEWITKSPVWNIADESIDYCISDTVLLGVCLAKFKEQVLTLTNNRLDPLRYATLPSAIMNYYLSDILPIDTIAVIDRSKCMESQIAHQWLLWAVHQQNFNNPVLEYEVKIGKHIVDGYHEESKTIFEFYGCYWHGHPSCMRKSEFNSVRKCTFAHCYKLTRDRELELLRQGYNLVIIWECEWHEKRKTMEVIDWMLENHTEQSLEMTSPIDPRSVYRGGMTEYYSLHYPGTINMVDFVSQYPAVCSGESRDFLDLEKTVSWPMPIGLPEHRRSSNCLPELMDILENTDYQGYAKVKILPPRQLFAPPLSIQVASKINKGSYETIFGLCKTCAWKRKNDFCTCSDEERAVIDTRLFCELRHFLELGYKILQATEYYSYRESSTTLFKDFLTPFMVNKIRTKKQGLIEDGMFTEEGLEICDYLLNLTGKVYTLDDFEDNPALRFVSKLMMNAFTGKWGQKEEHTTTACYEPARYDTAYKLLINPENDLKNVDLVKSGIKEFLYITYAPRHRSTIGHYEKNDVIIAHITAGGRIGLSRGLQALGTNALYCDTDSIFYKKEIDIPFKTGLRIGDLEQELVNGEDFVAIQRKSYAYKKPDGKATYRQKGIQLTSSNSCAFAPNPLLDLIHNTYNLQKEEPHLLEKRKRDQEKDWEKYNAQITVPQTYFLTKNTTDKIYKETHVSDKHVRFQIFAPKRWVQWPEDPNGEIITLPFGWCETS